MAPVGFRHLPPTGATFATNRGADQSGVLGTIQSDLVSSDALDTHLRDSLSSPLKSKGVCDEWFVDDGQVFVRPWSFDKWLRALDAALASFGATRGWSRVHDTVTVLSHDSGTTPSMRAWEAVMRSAWCSPSSTLTCPAHVPHARINGDLLHDDLLGSFDGQLRASVSSSFVETERITPGGRSPRIFFCGFLGLRTAFARPLARPFLLLFLN